MVREGGKGRSRGEGGSGCQNPTSPARYAISLRDLARSTGKKEERKEGRKEGRKEERNVVAIAM